MKFSIKFSDPDVKNLWDLGVSGLLVLIDYCRSKKGDLMECVFNAYHKKRKLTHVGWGVMDVMKAQYISSLSCDIRKTLFSGSRIVCENGLNLRENEVLVREEITVTPIQMMKDDPVIANMVQGVINEHVAWDVKHYYVAYDPQVHGRKAIPVGEVELSVGLVLVETEGDAIITDEYEWGESEILACCGSIDVVLLFLYSVFGMDLSDYGYKRRKGKKEYVIVWGRKVKPLWFITRLARHKVRKFLDELHL